VSVATTDADTIRAALAAQIQTIVPRFEPRRDDRWTWQQDAEIRGSLRNFDVVLEAETEVISDGAYGGGIEYTTVLQIVVSYPVPMALLPRFLGADGQDLAAILIRLHTTIPGMFPVEVALELSSTGDPGAYVGTFTGRLNFFASDVVATEAVA